jgi:hypothetical protein
MSLQDQIRMGRSRLKPSTIQTTTTTTTPTNPLSGLQAIIAKPASIQSANPNNPLSGLNAILARRKGIAGENDGDDDADEWDSPAGGRAYYTGRPFCHLCNQHTMSNRMPTYLPPRAGGGLFMHAPIPLVQSKRAKVASSKSKRIAGGRKKRKTRKSASKSKH